MIDTAQPTVDPHVEPPARTPVGHAGIRVDVDEHPAWAISGFLALLGALAMLGVAIWQVIEMVDSFVNPAPDGQGPVLPITVAVVAFVIMLLLVIPMVVIAPDETRVVQFFGRYIGTVRRTGLTWVVPLSTHRRVSVRVRNFETNTLKVNDADGNPVEIAAIVVWQVADTAKAVFAVDDYESFVSVQSESALRHVTTTQIYDKRRRSTSESASHLLAI